MTRMKKKVRRRGRQNGGGRGGGTKKEEEEGAGLSLSMSQSTLGRVWRFAGPTLGARGFIHRADISISTHLCPVLFRLVMHRKPEVLLFGHSHGGKPDVTLGRRLLVTSQLSLLHSTIQQLAL